MVGIDVDEGNPSSPGCPQRLNRNRSVVEVARASVGTATDVMPGRSCDRIGQRCTTTDEVDGRQRGIDRAARRLPRPFCDRRHRVEAVVARARPDRLRAMRPDGPEHRRGGKQVRHDEVLARVGRQPGLSPRRPGSPKKVDEVGVMDGEHDVVGVRLGLSQLGSLRHEGVANDARALGSLVIGHPHPQPDLGTRRVQETRVVPDDREG